MSLPAPRILAATHGYYPDVSVVGDLLKSGMFDEFLVLGAPIPDAGGQASVRVIAQPDVALPQGVYWFSFDPSSAEVPVAMVVHHGTGPAEPLHEPMASVAPGSVLDAALGWVDAMWEDATPVPEPRFPIGGDVLVRSTGQDGLVRSRSFSNDRWLYEIRTGGMDTRRAEADLDDRPGGSSPHEWLAQAPDPAHRLAATLTRAKLEQGFTDTVFSFRATRTIFRPYQFKPVLKLLNSGSARMLIADEVGLGKTIEAGLVWTELEARHHADRVLIVCPSNLASKWRREMDERFGFELQELDTAGLAQLMEQLATDRVPRRGAYICTLERLRRWEQVELATELRINFDLVIIDEAHALRNRGTKSHALGLAISQWADALIFLSATPVNLRNSDLFNLLDLLVPGEFDDLESLQARIAPNVVLNKVTGSLLDPTVTNADRLAWLDDLQRSRFGRIVQQRPDYDMLREQLSGSILTSESIVEIKRLASELHGLSAQLTRTRKVEVDEGKSLREPRTVPVLWDDTERAFYDEFLAWCIERARVKGQPLRFAMQMPLRLAGSCLPMAARSVLAWRTGISDGVEIDSVATSEVVRTADSPPPRRLRALAESLDRDTKRDQFVQIVADLVAQNRQALLFTFSRPTLAYLQQSLKGVARIGVLHGDVPRDERDKVMSTFREGGYDIMLATKVAAEGLDFEFCSVLINYDLPWNPMEIEQRIGRLDRIGQTEEKILIYNFSTPGTIETDILERVFERIEIFEHAIGQLEPIIDASWSKIEDVALDFSLTPEQRAQRALEAAAAVAEQRRAVDEVDEAAPFLLSSDGVDIDGLEPDLVASGRYVGQVELALLVADWVRTFGGRAEISDQLLTVVGNDELADHLQQLISQGRRSAREVADLSASLRGGQTIYLSLDQEGSRLRGTPLLTATHPLVHAALGVPSHRQSRFSHVHLPQDETTAQPGTYVVHLCQATWDGVRPLHEVWSSTVDAHTAEPVPDLGGSVMAAVAAGRLRDGRRTFADLGRALSVALHERDARIHDRGDALQRENAAFAEARRVGALEAHERRMTTQQQRLDTLRERGRSAAVVRMQEAQGRQQEQRHARLLNDLDRQAQASLQTQDLAVCVVEVY
ncbi:DEAD/DEAH box helicase [Janibacter anophelis]|uniref:DEAD/DEAH box helicase n=1 Tax=Janibacter anophelis TaxID=319054 RepID=UPI0013B04F14|nr:helicase-related protein [Janibacter anophelis]